MQLFDECNLHNYHYLDFILKVTEVAILLRQKGILKFQFVIFFYS
jgi:hypothetical protein